MPIRAFLRHHWPAITITVTAAAIACAAFVMLGNMPPHRIVMATGPEGSAYYEDGKRYGRRSRKPAWRCNLSRRPVR